MKQGSNARRSRRGNGKRQSKNTNFDSNGPEVRARGNAQQVLDKYLALARDAMASGDRIASENYFQHAEHYFRILHLNSGDDRRNGDAGNRAPRPSNTPADPDGGERFDAEATEQSDSTEGPAAPPPPDHEPDQRNDDSREAVATNLESPVDDASVDDEEPQQPSSETAVV